MDTLYVIPADCPDEDILMIPWGNLGAALQKTFEAISVRKNVRMEALYKKGIWLSWTCAGCTKSMGENPCPQRRCVLGGRPVPGAVCPDGRAELPL